LSSGGVFDGYLPALSGYEEMMSPFFFIFYFLFFIFYLFEI